MPKARLHQRQCLRHPRRGPRRRGAGGCVLKHLAQLEEGFVMSRITPACSDKHRTQGRNNRDARDRIVGQAGRLNAVGLPDFIGSAEIGGLADERGQFHERFLT